MGARSQVSGTIRGAGVLQPVDIVRDARDVPHIRAANLHDLYFAQGYAEASDRLFQMDLLRRYVYGRLAEVLGPAALSADENARVADIAHIVRQQWAQMSPRQRGILQAFSDGVNAAMGREPLPVEFHILLYKPEPWKPLDSLAAGMATVLDLIDPWGDVIKRDAVARAKGAGSLRDLYSITDPAYDAPIGPAIVAPVPPLGAMHAALPPRAPNGSNEFAIGAAHSATGRALLANDPHLRLAIPGVWYLVDLQGPGVHVAGGSLAGTPGVILGHNDDVAWGATNGTVVTESVYRDRIAGAQQRRETFKVRFSHDVVFTYYRTHHGFVAERSGSIAYAVDWNAVREPRSPLIAFDELNRARTIAQGLAALRDYPGPPQNFVLADRSGAVAYRLAGLIPNDPVWGLEVHPATAPFYPFIPIDRLPHVDPSRTALVYTANNRMYGAGYPYRLSPNFAAPYRAYRIRTLLRSKSRFSVSDLASMQRDTLSYPERDIARETLAAARRKHLDSDPSLHPYVAALSSWDGRFDPQSRGAAIAWELRRIATQRLANYAAGEKSEAYIASADNADVVLLMRVLRERPRGWWPKNDYDALLVESLREAVKRYGPALLEPWGDYGKVTVRHPLAGLGFNVLDGATFPGDGDSYGLHVQTATHSQSFRAVWDVGNWNAGGISIPSGESGQQASGHYTDQSRAWIDNKLVSLPFGTAAVKAAARQTLTLSP